MTIADLPPARVGVATSRGHRPNNCDVAAYHQYEGTGVLAVAVVDGTGNNEDVAHVAHVCAHTAVRVAARKGAVPGVLAATELIADPAEEFPRPDGVMVPAVCRPGEPVVLAHVGDCSSHNYSGKSTRRLR